ncbi:MAG: hypothetical protein IPK60_10875 [Sandaracinaceae bacterium]|nr:hypothetical protein [Sandaracinaceae bacterium]
MTTKLNRDAENFLASVRCVDDPGEGDKQRVRTALAATLAAGAVATSAGGASAGTTSAGAASAIKSSLAAASAATGMFSLPKVVLGIAIVLGGTGVFMATRERAHPATNTTTSRATSRVTFRTNTNEAPHTSPRAETSAASANALRVAVVPAPTPRLSLGSAPVAATSRRSPAQDQAIRGVAPEVAPAAAAPLLAPVVERPSTLREEMRLLREAQESVRDGRPQEAIRLLDAHEQNFAGGVLANERAVLRARAGQLLLTTPTVECDTSSTRSEH